MLNHMWERRADFKVARIGPTIAVRPISDAAKELCNKCLSGPVPAGPDGSLIISDDQLTTISRAILDEGMTMEDA